MQDLTSQHHFYRPEIGILIGVMPDRVNRFFFVSEQNDHFLLPRLQDKTVPVLGPPKNENQANHND
jgi:hypothetical protein